jgi:hypothetical protein
MALPIAWLSETIPLSAEQAAHMRAVAKPSELAVEEDIWGRRGVLKRSVDGQLGILPLPREAAHSSERARLVSCPEIAVQNVQEGEELHEGRRCFFQGSAKMPDVAKEVWLQSSEAQEDPSSFTHYGAVVTSNAGNRTPFCHVRLSPPTAAGNVECSAYRIPCRAADMVLGRLCMLTSAEVTDTRFGGSSCKLVATKMRFHPLEGVITHVSFYGVYIRPSSDIRYRRDSAGVPVVFAAFDRCTSTLKPDANKDSSLLNSRAFFDLCGPISSPEAYDWKLDDGVQPCKWRLPVAPKLSIKQPACENLQNARWFPWQWDEPNIVIASDPRKTKFRDDAFECKLDGPSGIAFLRVHIVNMAGAIPKDSPQERWMRRIQSRHHPADAYDMRTLFGDWVTTSAGIGFTTAEHRPALTMQLNMAKHEEAWAVKGDPQFFESMVQLSVIVDAEQVTEDWIKMSTDQPTPDTLVVYPPNCGTALAAEIQQVFHDAQTVRDNRWRRISDTTQPELHGDAKSSSTDDEDGSQKEVSDDARLPAIRFEISYNSNARVLTVISEEMQPSHFYAKRLLETMNSEVFQTLEGYKEMFGLVRESALMEHYSPHWTHHCAHLVDLISSADAGTHLLKEEIALKDLQNSLWEALGSSLSDLYEAFEWGTLRKKMAMACDVPDDVGCKFEFTKPGRLYGHLVSQRILLDFVRNGMKRPRRMSYGMEELRDLMEQTNQRRQLKEKMDFDRDQALLDAAWPLIMERGGLPVNAIVVREDLVFVPRIQVRVSCPDLLDVSPPVVAGTKVIIQLLRTDVFAATLLAIHRRYVEFVERVDGQKHVFSLSRSTQLSPPPKSAEGTLHGFEQDLGRDVDLPAEAKYATVQGDDDDEVIFRSPVLQ